jgi:hypothetical protein
VFQFTLTLKIYEFFRILQYFEDIPLTNPPKKIDGRSTKATYFFRLETLLKLDGWIEEAF